MPEPPAPTPAPDSDETARAGDPGATGPGFLGRNRDSIKTLLLYGGWIAGLFVLFYQVPFVKDEIVAPYTGLVARSAEAIIGLFGTDVTRKGSVLTGPGGSLRILEECNGVSALLIFLAAVLAHPVPIRFKLLGIALGVPAIYAFNLIRVVSLCYLRWHWEAMFDIMHEYVWQALVIFFAIFTWLYWAGLCGPSKRPRAEASPL